MWADDAESTVRPAPAPESEPAPAYQQPERRSSRPAPPREPQRQGAQRASASRQPAPRYERPAPPQPPAPYYEADYYDEPDDYYEGDSGWLRNPYVLAGVAVLGAIILAVVVVVFFGQGGDTPDQGAVGGEPTVQLPVGDGTAIVARSIATATVREGPALSYLELGLLRSGQDVRVVGRNDAATWFEIVYPHNSDMRGWVPGTALRVNDSDLERLAVVDVTPVPRPTVDLPTPIPRPEDPTPEPDATETPEPQNEPVLSVAISGGCTNGQQIVIVLLNSGTEDMQNTPFQLIISNDGVVVYDEMLAATMVAGQTAQYPTGIPARPQSMSVTVSVPNSDALPSVSTCTVVEQGSGNVPPPFATPTPNNN